MKNAHEVRISKTHAGWVATALAVLAAIALGMATPPSAKAQQWQLTTLYNFCSQANCADGQSPAATLVQGTDGNFYGTTLGPYQYYGTIFKITPSGTLTTLYNFCSQGGDLCTDGESPWGLVQGSDGNFYGTTKLGGGHGTVFRITPSGALTTLYTFCSLSGCSDGLYPSGALVQGSDGNFYGTTSYGGAYYYYGGTVFKITPSGDLTTLYSFCVQDYSCTDGQYPGPSLVQGSDGNFYGTTQASGAYGAGTVFKITSSGALTTLHNFCAQGGPCPDGQAPYSGVVQGSDGNFYGTTGGGGTTDYGTIFKITPAGALTTLYNFCAQGGDVCPDGRGPTTGVVQGSDGNFYGTTLQGGLSGYMNGTAFNITPSGALTTLYLFCSQDNCADGYYPAAGLVQGNDGNFYGTTYAGGANDSGTVYKLTLPLGIATVSPDSLTFGPQDVGTTSSSQPVTLSNTGGAPLTVNTIVASGDFAETDNCNGSVAAGHSCTINVTFSPTLPGTRTGTLTITDNSDGAPGSQQTVSLTGTGINPGATLSPTSLSFGSQVVNTTSVAKKVTLTSSGTTSLTFTGITFTGANPGDFAQTNNCPSTLNVGSKCTINVTFTPSTVGAESATLNVNDNAANAPQTAALSGTGVADVTLTPTTANFGNVGEGTPSAVHNFTLTNNQSAALTISSISTGNPDYTETDACAGSVAPKSHCTISVTLTPTTLGADAGALTVNSNAPAPYNSLSSSLTGKGVVPATLTPTSANFGNVPQGIASSPHNFTLTNNNQTAALAISSITTGNPDYTESDTCAGSVAPKGHCTITITFTPSNIGTETGTLTVNDSASNTPQTGSLTGTGIAQVTLTPSSITFPAQKVGTTSAAHNATLHNNLSSALPFTVTFTGADPSDFGATNNCGGSVPAKSSCTVSVTFTPQAKGTRTATLNINDSANNSPQMVSLTGTGK